MTSSLFFKVNVHLILPLILTALSFITLPLKFVCVGFTLLFSVVPVFILGWIYFEIIFTKTNKSLGYGPRRIEYSPLFGWAWLLGPRWKSFWLGAKDSMKEKWVLKFGSIYVKYLYTYFICLIPIMTLSFFIGRYFTYSFDFTCIF